jgi:hypothetical protein
MRLVPTYEHVDPTQLTENDLRIITNNSDQIAQDGTTSWQYECRRQAQRILEFLYVGPTSVVKDRSWLEEQGITMVMTVHDPRFAKFVVNMVEKHTEALGIETAFINISSSFELIHAFTGIIKTINDHLLSVYRRQAVCVAESDLEEPGMMAIDQSNTKRGKVLVTCETGNERSVAIVAAYIMAIFAKSMPTTIQFITLSRFCSNFEEETKRILVSWEDILAARRQVVRSEPTTERRKRDIEAVYQGDDSSMEGQEQPPILDQDRYVGRSSFVPFVDDMIGFN